MNPRRGRSEPCARFSIARPPRQHHHGGEGRLRRQKGLVAAAFLQASSLQTAGQGLEAGDEAIHTNLVGQALHDRRQGSLEQVPSALVVGLSEGDGRSPNARGHPRAQRGAGAGVQLREVRLTGDGVTRHAFTLADRFPTDQRDGFRHPDRDWPMIGLQFGRGSKGPLRLGLWGLCGLRQSFRTAYGRPAGP